MTPQPGHEDCLWDADRTVIKQWGGKDVRTIVECHHDHRDPVYALDHLGPALLVAYHCRCCTRILREPNYE